MRYKLEIIADSLGELMTKTRITFVEVSSDPEFQKRIESKEMSSVFFTKYANIHTIDNSNDSSND
jgi:hypothetical protein